MIDVLVCKRRDAAPGRAFFACVFKFGPSPVEVTTDRAPVYPQMIDDLAPNGETRVRAVCEQRRGS